MAKISEIDQAAWDKWVAERPPSVQTLCRLFPPDRLYLLKTSKHRVTIHSYSEDGTMTVYVSGDYNLIVFPRPVFGIKPEDLVECDLPAEGEPLGCATTDPEEIKKIIAEYQAHNANT
jgi:hypothetical protein